MNLNRLGFISVFCWLAGVVLFLFLAFDGRLHWDEPGYLYTGGYLSLSQILHGEFQPSGIEGFYMSRILHVLLIHVVVMVTGLGVDALATLLILYLLLLFAFSYVTYLILRELLPKARGLTVAVAVSAFTPMYLYFAFKTMPEIPALLLAAVATLGLLRSMKGRRTVLWLSVIAFSLAGMALLKNNMALLYVSSIVALLLCKPRQYPPGKLILHAFISGVGSLALFYVALMVMGIELSSYLAVVSTKLTENEWPLVAKILNTGLEGGIFFLALPLAFLVRPKKAVFFAVWFLVATLPVLLLVEDINSRYLAPNLVAFSGLIYLTINGLTPHVVGWWRRTKLVTVVAGCIILVAIVASNAVALAIMSHEVRMDQLDTVLTRLDRLYGRPDYVILTSWSYTDFHYLRFVYPNREVYNVDTTGLFEADSPEANEYRAYEDRYYPGRMIRTPEKLVALNTDLVYLGFEENFSVANLRTIIRSLPGISLESQLDKMTFINHLSLSWMWEHPQLVFLEQIRHGHYITYNVEVDPKPTSGALVK